MYFKPKNSLLLAGTKLKSTYKSLYLAKDYDQTSTTTQHSVNQPRSEQVKFDNEWVDKRVENRVAASCKKKAYW